MNPRHSRNSKLVRWNSTLVRCLVVVLGGLLSAGSAFARNPDEFIWDDDEDAQTNDLWSDNANWTELPSCVFSCDDWWPGYLDADDATFSGDSGTVFFDFTTETIDELGIEIDVTFKRDSGVSSSTLTVASLVIVAGGTPVDATIDGTNITIQAN